MRRWLALIAASLLLATADAGVTHASATDGPPGRHDVGVPPGAGR